MLLNLNDLTSGRYKELKDNKVSGFSYKITSNPVLNENGEPIRDDEGSVLLDTVKTIEDLEFSDNLMFIQGDGVLEHSYIDSEGNEKVTNYVNDAFLVKYLNNGEDAYYVAFNRPRVKNNTIIGGTSVDNYIASKTCEDWDTFKQISVAKSTFNSNVNLSTEEFETMDDFINAEKDINLTYIVGNKYEVFFDGSNEDSLDYSEDDYNDWFVRVMRNEYGAYTKDGDFIMGYLLSDFINNKDSIESDVDNIENRINIYNK